MFETILKVGKVGKVGLVGKVGKVGKEGREGLIMHTWNQLGLPVHSGILAISWQDLSKVFMLKVIVKVKIKEEIRWGL
jgi:hypothetical protein